MLVLRRQLRVLRRQMLVLRRQLRVLRRQLLFLRRQLHRLRGIHEHLLHLRLRHREVEWVQLLIEVTDVFLAVRYVCADRRQPPEDPHHPQVAADPVANAPHVLDGVHCPLDHGTDVVGNRSRRIRRLK